MVLKRVTFWLFFLFYIFFWQKFKEAEHLHTCVHMSMDSSNDCHLVSKEEEDSTMPALTESVSGWLLRSPCQIREVWQESCLTGCQVSESQPVSRSLQRRWGRVSIRSMLWQYKHFVYTLGSCEVKLGWVLFDFTCGTHQAFGHSHSFIHKILNFWLHELQCCQKKNEWHQND